MISDEHYGFTVSIVQELYIAELEDGNRSKAMNRLRVPPLQERSVSVKYTLMGQMRKELFPMTGKVFIFEALKFCTPVGAALCFCT